MREEFNNPVDVVVGLISVERPTDTHNMLVGITRGKQGDSGYGKIALPGGFVNPGESLEEAIVREVKEEVGFETEPVAWALTHSRHLKDKNINLVFCLYRFVIKSDVLASAVPNAEVSAFSYIDGMTKLAFPTHEEAVRIFYARYDGYDPMA